MNDLLLVFISVLSILVIYYIIFQHSFKKIAEGKVAICQSCGMPMEKDEYFGTSKDGSKSKEYCKFCFNKGKFIDEGITMKEKIEKNIKIAKEMGMDEKKARKMAEMTIPKLKRWRK